MPPRISVVLPVFNGELFIADAIRSLLDQTFGDFELLVIDDGSTDRTPEILKTFQDSRMRVIKNAENLGLIRSLNLGIELARGEFIARMDADDIAFPKRLETQLAFLNNNPGVSVVGSNIVVFNQDTVDGRCLMTPPQTAAQIHWELLRVSCLYHPTVLIRRSVFADERAYDPEYTHCEDYELWLRLSRRFELANIPESLLYYRRHDLSIGRLHQSLQREHSERALALEIERRIGLTPTRNATRLLMAPRLLTEVSDVCEFRSILPLLMTESLQQSGLTTADRNFIQMSAMATIARLVVRATLKKQKLLAPLLKLLFFEMGFGFAVFLRFPFYALNMLRAKRFGAG